MKKLIAKHWMLFVLLVIAAIAHGWNMQGFPYYENDEGVYMSQAWSLLSEGKLAPYTYWYDHAPAGWMFLAVWVKLTGGLFTFGMSAASGRVFMWVLHILMTAMVYFLGVKTTKSRGVGILAGLIFSVSPLAVYYQRRVLLDNIAAFWVLVSLTIVFWKEKLSIWRGIIAGLVFGIAVLSKEVAVFFLPGILFAMWSRRRSHKLFVLVPTIIMIGFVIATYFLYALLKTELWPVGFLGDNRERVSLIDTLQYQSGRGIRYPFWDSRSGFAGGLATWSGRNEMSIWLGGAGLIGCGLLALFVKPLRVIAALGWSFAVFLLTNKLIYDFYIIPIVPFAALCVASVVGWIVMLGKRINLPVRAMWLVVCIGISAGLLSRPIGQYTQNHNKPLADTIKYIRQNAKPTDHIGADAAILLDLWEAPNEGDQVFANADWFWKIEKDSEVYEGKLKNDWRNLDYVLVSHEMLRQIRDQEAALIDRAVANSDVVRLYDENTTAYINLAESKSTNGDWMGVLKVRDAEWIVLLNSWKYYKNNFIHSYGQVIDPQTGNTTSEGQAYAMLRAVWVGDQQTFGGVWQWTKDHMQHRQKDKLLSWLWRDNKQADSASAADADVDIALALVMAAERWNEPKYKADALELVKDIWRVEVESGNGRYYLTAGSDMSRDGGYVVNPSYFSPAHYRVFAKIDKLRPWKRLAEDSYVWMGKFAATTTTGLLPNWVWISETGVVGDPTPYMGKGATEYSFDAFRSYFRAGLDWQWYKSPAADKLLKQAAKQFFGPKLSSETPLLAAYDKRGRSTVTYKSLAVNTGAVFATINYDLELAKKLYAADYDKTLSPVFDGYWGEKENYFDQNWTWFVSAYMTGNLVNFATNSAL